jgi:hypothetical protein
LLSSVQAVSSRQQLRTTRLVSTADEQNLAIEAQLEQINKCLSLPEMERELDAKARYAP